MSFGCDLNINRLNKVLHIQFGGQYPPQYSIFWSHNCSMGYRSGLHVMMAINDHYNQCQNKQKTLRQ